MDLPDVAPGAILYFPVHTKGGLLYVGDCKMGALTTRATIVQGHDFYLCPLSATQMPQETLAPLLEPVWAGTQALASVHLPSDNPTVPAKLIAEHGAVSREVAISLAEGIRERTRATFGVGITGVAGPTGGTPEKPVGLVFIAISDGKEHEVVERRLPGDRERIRLWASFTGLDLVRRKLL